MEQKMLEKYAHLLVHAGLNVQKDQEVIISASVEQYPFVELLTKTCYEAGAKEVRVEWSFAKKRLLDYTYASAETLGQVKPWEEAKMAQQAEDCPAMLHIMSDGPDAMNGMDAEKFATVTQARQKVMKPYRSKMDGKYQWLIAAVPSPEWAKKVFPTLGEDEAVEALWREIMRTCYVTEDNDPVTARQAHDRYTMAKADWLTKQGFASLRYHSANGTDFTVELIPGATWCAAGETNSTNGAFYVPNMPTEEVFTSPMAGRCEGTLVSTKPLSYNGQMVENFSVTFRDGKAVSCQAEVGQAVLEKIISMDEHACMLGEVALVAKESPINQSGLLFYNTLFDENAACHVALGRGFKEILPDGAQLTVEEAEQRGINDSIVHVDFMVGSDDLSIVGVKPDGTEVPVFVNGTWATA
ncbi:MAG: aminopeptidase [Oscillospiraceae bacterium]|nr:aminopeptidase [Oscillospiraceae bacterium]